MCAASVIAYSAKPTRFMADISPRKTLAEEVPTEFLHWKKGRTDLAAVLDPTQQAVLNYLYTETLSANYINPSNRLVMLSIAYGKDQSDGHDVHKPDLCYPAQGFKVLEQRDMTLVLDDQRSITVRYMKTQLGNRIEPLVFWTTAGDYVYQTKLQKKIIGMKYSAENLIPDGLVLRVSMIEPDPEIALTVISDFIKTWYDAMPEQQRYRYFGQKTL
ncbi:MAG: epsI [Proteobacteria bacterium]|nr:epsI [Pseudomonadota bacterium]